MYESACRRRVTHASRRARPLACDGRFLQVEPELGNRKRSRRRFSRHAFSSPDIYRRNSPFLREANHCSRILQLREQLADGHGLIWQDQIGPDVGEWSKHEVSQMKTRMRQLQLLILHVELVRVKNVDVDLARSVAGVISL